MAQDGAAVTLGVDTHADVHVAVLIDELGRVLGTRTVETVEPAYRRLLKWASGHGDVRLAGVEGTGSYGAGLARFLAQQGIAVVEVDRPNRQRRRKLGKSDPVDAEQAARAALSGEARVVPKARDGIVESIRVLRITRSSAVKARTQVANQVRDILLTAPPEIRDPLRRLTTRHRIDRCARFHADDSTRPAAATKRALRHLARRYQALTAEIRSLDADLIRLTNTAAPRLLAQAGVGVESAAKLLIAAGDNVDRLTSDAALAALCGVSPVEASSGRVVRHRLNRGGDRQANNALWTIAWNRLRYDPETRAYAERRTSEGRTRKEIIRCLKRFLARRLYPLLLEDLANARSLTLT